MTLSCLDDLYRRNLCVNLKLTNTYVRKFLKRIPSKTLMALLADQFQTEDVNALTPALQRVNDLQKLKELHLAAARVPNIETFAQMLNE